MKNRIMIMLLAVGFSSLQAMQQSNDLPVPKVNLKIINKTNKNFFISNIDLEGGDPLKPINTGIEAHSTRTLSFDLDSTDASKVGPQLRYYTSLSFFDIETYAPLAILQLYFYSANRDRNGTPFKLAFYRRNEVDYVEIPYNAQLGEDVQLSAHITLEGNNLENSTIDVSAKQEQTVYLLNNII